MAQNTEVVKSDNSEICSELILENIITQAMKIPGCKVDRDKFLAELFVKETDDINLLVKSDPIAVGFTKDKLNKIAEKLIIDRTAKSSIASFAMGIPGGLAIAATIPADMLQFYGMTLKLAQELSYIYGANDLWVNGVIDEAAVRDKLIIYCGAMFGVSGAAAGVRLLSAQLAKTALKKIPQKALTKTFWYPIIKQIGKSVGLTVTKKTLANGVTKVIPVVSGVVSGVITFASMMPMAERLRFSLEESVFDYTDEEMHEDINTISKFDENNKEEQKEPIAPPVEKEKKKSLFEKGKEKVGNLFKKKEKEEKLDEYDQIKKLKELLDAGAITQEEYDAKKREILKL